MNWVYANNRVVDERFRSVRMNACKVTIFFPCYSQIFELFWCELGVPLISVSIENIADLKIGLSAFYVNDDTSTINWMADQKCETFAQHLWMKHWRNFISAVKHWTEFKGQHRMFQNKICFEWNTLANVFFCVVFFIIAFQHFITINLSRMLHFKMTFINKNCGHSTKLMQRYQLTSNLSFSCCRFISFFWISTQCLATELSPMFNKKV